MGTHAQAKPTVLIVDRTSLDCRILEFLLRPMARVITRSNAWKSMELLDARAGEFDAILVEDRILDESSIADHLTGRHRSCRVVALSSSTDAVDRRRLMARGATAVLVKPYLLKDITRLLLG